jgi:hypothetical protein
MATRKRGSTKLAARQAPVARLSEVDVRKVIALSQRKGIKVVDWWIYGQPAPDVIGGTFQTAPRLAGSLVQALLTVKGIRQGIEVFPLGIPFPREVQIRFEAGARVR